MLEYISAIYRSKLPHIFHAELRYSTTRFRYEAGRIPAMNFKIMRIYQFKYSKPGNVLKFALLQLLYSV